VDRVRAFSELIKDWPLTNLEEKPIKIAAEGVGCGRNGAFRTAEVAIPRNLFAGILPLIAELRPPSPLSTA
jgi:hypothetical protein